MKYADLKYITKSTDFNEFIKEFNFEFFNFENKIYLFSKCLSLEIYAYKVEEIAYFQFYNEDLNLTVDVDALLYAKDLEKIKQISQHYTHRPLSVEKTETAAEKILRLQREIYFFEYLSLMRIFLSDFLKCENRNFYFKYFTSAFHIAKERVERAKMEFLKTRKSRFLLDDEIL